MEILILLIGVFIGILINRKATQKTTDKFIRELEIENPANRVAIFRVALDDTFKVRLTMEGKGSIIIDMLTQVFRDNENAACLVDNALARSIHAIKPTE